MKITLDKLQPGERGIVSKIKTIEPTIKTRILELGLIAGASVELIRFAPLGDPVEIKLRGYRLSIRKEDAEFVEVITKNGNC